MEEINVMLGLNWTHIIIAVMGLVGLLILYKSPMFQTAITKKRLKISDGYIKDLEEEIDYLKKEKRTLQIKANAKEAGPQIEGDMSELDSVLPELFGSFEQYAPKWLKPFLGNKDTQKWLIDYAQKNPEKVQNMLGKIMRKKGVKNDNGQAQSDGISV